MGTPEDAYQSLLMKQMNPAQPPQPTSTETTTNTSAERAGGSLKRYIGIDPQVAAGVNQLVEESEGVQDLKEGITQQESALQKLMQVEGDVPTWSKIDMTMPLAFFDEMNGTNLAKSYKPYKSPTGIISNLQTNILASKGKLAATRQKMFKDYLKDTQQTSQDSSQTRSVSNVERTGGMGGMGLDDVMSILRLQHAKGKADTEATKDVNKMVDPESFSRLTSNLDVMSSIMKPAIEKGEDIPAVGTADSREATGTGSDRTLYGDFMALGRSLGMGGGPEHQEKVDTFRAAAGDILATVTKLYSGAAASDTEVKRLAATLALQKNVSEKSYIKAYNNFIKKWKNDLISRLAIVNSNPRLKKAYENIDPNSKASLEDFNQLMIEEGVAEPGEKKSFYEKKASKNDSEEGSYSDDELLKLMEGN